MEEDPTHGLKQPSRETANLLEYDVGLPEVSGLRALYLGRLLTAVLVVASLVSLGVSVCLRISSVGIFLAPTGSTINVEETKEDALDALRDASAKGLFKADVCANAEPSIMQVVEATGKVSNSPANFVRPPTPSFAKWLLRMPLPGNVAVRVYSTLDFESAGPWPEVETAVIVVHGALRNADDDFCILTRAVRKAAEYISAASRLLVLAPWFEMVTDEEQDEDIQIFNKGWYQGSHCLKGHRESSFAVLDAMVDQLRQRAGTNLPNLQRVVLTGHSAGGQFVMYHALWTQMPNVAHGVAVRWIPADVRSFVYFDRRRWAYTDPEGPFVLADLDDINASFWCRGSKSFNRWPLGLERSKLGPRDLNRIGEAASVQRFASRHVTLILGMNDTCNLCLRPGGCRPDPAHGWPDSVHDHVCLGKPWSGLGSGEPVPHMMTVTADFRFQCGRLLEGPWRLQRGRLYVQYLRENYGIDNIRVREVPGVGHVDKYIFDSHVFSEALLGPR